MGGVVGQASAWVADECNRVLGGELLPEEEEQHAELVKVAKIEEPDAWKKFDVSDPRRGDTASKQVAQPRWVLAWQMAGGRKSVKAKLAAKGYQDPDLQEGIVGATGCVGLMSSHLPGISLRAIKKWKL